MFTISTVGRGANDWAVFAHWHGKDRIVYGPATVWECAAWKNGVEEGPSIVDEMDSADSKTVARVRAATTAQLG